jgi:hypothetical protein
MRKPASRLAWLLPLLLLTSCFHRTHPAQTAALAPPVTNLPPPNTAPVDTPKSASSIPTRATENAEIVAEKLPPRQPRVRRHKPVADKNPEMAAVETPEVSAVGQLTTGDPADYRLETEDLIATTERGLSGLNRQLSDPEKKIADQLREFLKQAREALSSGDVDGAHTLAAKAKVLLTELIK